MSCFTRLEHLDVPVSDIFWPHSVNQNNILLTQGSTTNCIHSNNDKDTNFKKIWAVWFKKIGNQYKTGKDLSTENFVKLS